MPFLPIFRRSLRRNEEASQVCCHTVNLGERFVLQIPPCGLLFINHVHLNAG